MKRKCLNLTEKQKNLTDNRSKNTTHSCPTTAPNAVCDKMRVDDFLNTIKDKEKRKQVAVILGVDDWRSRR